MTENIATQSAPIPAPPVKGKPATREEIIKLLTSGEGDFTVSIKA